MVFPHRRRRVARSRSLVASAALCLACALASGPGAHVAKADDLETLRVTDLPMSRVAVRGSVEVEISQGEPAELLMRGPADQLAHRPFIARESLLILGDSEGPGRRDVGDVRYKLTLPTLTELVLAGSGTVYVRPLVVDELRVILEGSGDLRLHAVDARGHAVRLGLNGSGDLEIVELHAGDLDLSLAGSGDMRFDRLTVDESLDAVVKGSGDIVARGSGRAADVELAIVGSGDVDLRRVDADSLEVNIVGSGNARIGRLNKLDLTVLGSGDVYYAGDPETSTTILGSGRLHDTDD